MDVAAADAQPDRTVVRGYHERSKHHLQRYAAGPETLDWDAQPNPFRRWDGAPPIELPLVADRLDARWHQLDQNLPVHAFTREAIAAFFELSFAIAGWKRQGPDRWALRVNPSSGNLHPTEAYLLVCGVADLVDGLYHYAPREHALEQRATVNGPQARSSGAPGLWIGLSSVQWREAWKYGERAFRYCQLDAGHAVGAVRYAAATLGWQARVVPNLGWGRLAGLLGLDRAQDLGHAEPEEPELLVQVAASFAATATAPPPWREGTQWQGRANRLDSRPMYRWPAIDAVASATREPQPLPRPD